MHVDVARRVADRANLDVNLSAVEVTEPLGNPWKATYDVGGRIRQVQRPLTDDGTGTGNIVATAVSTWTWDDLSLPLTATDAEGNTVSWAHDGLGRVTQLTSADGTSHTYAWDDRDNLASVTDAAGSVRTMTYDRLDRLRDLVVTPGPGVAGTTFEQRRYDGTGALVRAVDRARVSP